MGVVSEAESFVRRIKSVVSSTNGSFLARFEACRALAVSADVFVIRSRLVMSCWACMWKSSQWCCAFVDDLMKLKIDTFIVAL